jgi:hypothetical protein
MINAFSSLRIILGLGTKEHVLEIYFVLGLAARHLD